MSPLSVARSIRDALIVPLILAALAVSALPRVSNAAPARASIRTITIASAHLAFPKSIPAGMLALRVVADTRSSLDAGLARVNRGVTMSQVETASASGDFIHLSRLVTFMGGVGVPQRSTGTAILDLRTAGMYGLHITRGDRDPGRDLLFTVTPVGTQTATAPKADVTVTLRGTRFVGLPSSLPAGTITFKITNSSSWVRDMILFRLDSGKTVQDMIAAAKVDEQTGKDPSWAHAMGSMDVLSPYQTYWATISLTPGAYVALCPLPDPQKNGTALMLEGMIVPFTVS